MNCLIATETESGSYTICTYIKLKPCTHWRMAAHFFFVRKKNNTKNKWKRYGRDFYDYVVNRNIIEANSFWMNWCKVHFIWIDSIENYSVLTAINIERRCFWIGVLYAKTPRVKAMNCARLRFKSLNSIVIFEVWLYLHCGYLATPPNAMQIKSFGEITHVISWMCIQYLFMLWLIGSNEYALYFVYSFKKYEFQGVESSFKLNNSMKQSCKDRN